MNWMEVPSAPGRALLELSLSLPPPPKLLHLASRPGPPARCIVRVVAGWAATVVMTTDGRSDLGAEPSARDSPGPRTHGWSPEAL